MIVIDTTPKSIMLDFDSTVFRLLDAMNLCPGGERVKYEDCPTWEYLMQLCGPEGDHTDEERLKFMLDLFGEAMKLERMHQLGNDGVFAGCREVVNRLHSDGVKIYVVTDRPEHLIEGTAMFLDDHDIRFDEIHRVSGKDKTQWCKEHGISIMIDDHPDTLKAAVEAGLDAFSLTHLYNKDVEGAKLYGTWADMEASVRGAVGLV